MTPDQRLAVAKFCILLAERCPEIVTGKSLTVPDGSEVVLRLHVARHDEYDRDFLDGEDECVFSIEDAGVGPFTKGSVVRLVAHYWNGNLVGRDEAPVFVGRAHALEAVREMLTFFRWCAG